MKSNESGFTLVELMVALAMAGIVSAVIYTAYNVQSKIYTEQGQVAEMQQNLRSAFFYMQREVRMAGYNRLSTKHVSCSSGGTTLARPGIHTATATTIGFSMDIDNNGDCGGTGENVTYSLYEYPSGVWKIGRAAPTQKDPVAQNITHAQFMYLFAPPGLGEPVTDPPTATPALSDLDKIVAVQISLLARSGTPDREKAYTAKFTVPVPDAWGRPTANPPVWQPFNDSYSRRLLVTTINLRNMGLLP